MCGRGAQTGPRALTCVRACACADLGHGGAGAVPVAGQQLLPGRGLLHSGVRRDHPEELRGPGDVAQRVPRAGQRHRPRPLPVRGARQQGRPGRAARRTSLSSVWLVCVLFSLGSH